MALHSILSVRHKEPAWIAEGANEYLKRLGNAVRDCAITPPSRSPRANAESFIDKEAALISSALRDLPKKSVKIGMHERGTLMSTAKLAVQIEKWQQNGAMIWIIGGADGLSDKILDQCEMRLSLSPMTFPHSLARLILLEQIYRATTMIQHHPYHRAS